jgi:hypothetical protein
MMNMRCVSAVLLLSYTHAVAQEPHGSMLDSPSLYNETVVQSNTHTGLPDDYVKVRSHGCSTTGLALRTSPRVC